MEGSFMGLSFWARGVARKRVEWLPYGSRSTHEDGGRKDRADLYRRWRLAQLAPLGGGGWSFGQGARSARTLPDGAWCDCLVQAGWRALRGMEMPSAAYITRLTAGETTEQRRLLLVK